MSDHGNDPDTPRTAAWAGTGDSLEKTRLDLGFIPLTDCAPLVVAREKGFFARHGLQVTLHRQSSWASLRDKVAVGVLDGAQMLAPMPIAASLGINGVHEPLLAALSLDLNGNAITVSEGLYQRMVEADPQAMTQRPLTARALKAVIEADRRAGRGPLTFATVYPFSGHNYELRYWLAAAGVDPDRDLRLIVIPPPQMVANLRAGSIDGYCVGEPWNARAVQSGVGRILITKHELWNNSPEKVLGVRRGWAEKHPNTHKALIMALLEACHWVDLPDHRLEAVKLIARSEYVNAPLDVVRLSMTGSVVYQPGEDPRHLPDFNVFFRYCATFPWVSHAVWFMTQMYRWGQLDQPLNLLTIAREVYRPDLYREAAAALGLDYPTVDLKSEGLHARPWPLVQATAPIPMGPDCFFDGAVFDPSRPAEYLHRQPVRHTDLASLERVSELCA